MKKKSLLILIIIGFVLNSCHSKEIGGNKMGLTKDFVKTTSIKEFQNRPKNGKEIIFEITHENSDLANYDLLIFDINDYYYYYYYGPYQKNISILIPNSPKNHPLSMVFSLINKKTDSVYSFQSNLTYFLSEATHPIKVKLLSEYKRSKGEWIGYKLTGCSNDIRK
jgi:hypothetical protein